MRHIKGNIINVAIGSPYASDCQKPFTYFSIEEYNAQGPKTIINNINVTQPRDLTAYRYNLYLLRGRSFHSSNSAKESSRISKSLEVHVSNIKDADKPNRSLNSGGKSITSVSTWAKSEVNNYVNKEGLFNGLINIIANPEFLKACYLEIKSKPGNMSKGTSPETLDGINVN